MIILDKTKNGTRRIVPINNTLHALLEPLIAEAGEHLFTTTEGPKKYRGKPYTVAAVSRAFHRATLRAGIADLRFHDLRHAWASRLRRNKVDLLVLQRLGGWKKLDMVKRYSNVLDDELHAAAAVLDCGITQSNTKSSSGKSE